MDNCCDASFDETPHKKARLSAQADYNGRPIPKGINIWWCSLEANKLFCPEPNQIAYSDVQSQIYMFERSLATHKPYKYGVELEDGNDILSAYQMYRFRTKCYYLCTALFIAKEKIHTTTWFACCSVHGHIEECHVTAALSPNLLETRRAKFDSHHSQHVNEAPQ